MTKYRGYLFTTNYDAYSGMFYGEIFDNDGCPVVEHHTGFCGKETQAEQLCRHTIDRMLRP